jgi:PEP-CTERM motif
MKLNPFFAAVLALAACASASAGVVYENGTDGTFRSGNNPFTYQLVTQNFTLGSDAVVRSLTYDAFTRPGTLPVNDVLVKFYANNGGVIGNELFSGHFGVANQKVIGGNGYYSFTDFGVNLGDVSLAAGNYFLGLEVGPQQWDMHWSIAAPSNAGVSASDGSGHYFRLDDTAVGVAAVPEPETYAMMLAGLGLMGFVARRRTARG